MPCKAWGGCQVPFYKPYGMTDEEYEYEVAIAEQRLAEWEAENEEGEITWKEITSHKSTRQS